MINITIAEVQPTHIKDILSIADQELGNGYLTTKEIQKCIEHPKKHGLVAYWGNELVGFTMVETLSVAALSNLVLKEKKWIKNTFSDNESIGYRRHTVVKKSHQKKGIGSVLAKRSTTELDKTVNCIISIGWENELLIPIRKALEKNGYSIVKIIDNYWTEDSLERKYSCPNCGQPPCNCSAHIFVRYN